MEGNNHPPQHTSCPFVLSFLWVAELPQLLPAACSGSDTEHYLGDFSSVLF